MKQKFLILSIKGPIDKMAADMLADKAEAKTGLPTLVVNGDLVKYRVIETGAMNRVKKNRNV